MRVLRSSFPTHDRSRQHGPSAAVLEPPPKVRTGIPLLPGLFKQTRPDPQIWTQHVPSVLQTIRQGYWICQAGLKSAAIPDGLKSLDVWPRCDAPVLQINVFLLTTSCSVVLSFLSCRRHCFYLRHFATIVLLYS